MATLTFSYRSKKDEAFLETRLSYRIPNHNLNPKTGKEMPYSYYTRSKISVSKGFWEEYKKGVRFKDAAKIKIRRELEDAINNLKDYVMAEFEKVDVATIDRKWLKDTVSEFYNPKQPKNKDMIPDKLNEYFDYYLTMRDHEISSNLKSRYLVVKRKLERFDANLMIKEINESFKKDFVEWSRREKYDPSTIERDVKYVKTVVKHARLKGVEVHPEYEVLKVKKEKAPIIYLSLDEINRIQDLENLPDYLDNARDWLLISCFTGQRVSDFMCFDKSMIRKEGEKVFLEFTQEKTEKDMAIPVLKEVREVLDKRGGDFPRKISDQRYNEYIKIICEKANINQIMEGKIATNISEDENKTIMRKVLGMYPKWQLVTSHIGRRSFASNFYGKLATIHLIGITGHSSEKLFLTYIGKGQKDLAFDAYEHFMRLDEQV